MSTKQIRMEALALAGMGLGFLAYTYPRDSPGATDISVDESKRALSYRKNYKDSQEMGISYSIMKPLNLELTNLNDAWKPWGAPEQTPTKSMGHFLRNRANIDSHVETYAYPFYFKQRTKGEIPLASNQQAAINVEVPSSKSSFRWDHGDTLLTFPRVYTGGSMVQYFSTEESNMFDAGEPTEAEVVRVPREGKLTRDYNPWGPGGKLQTLYNKRNERLSKKFGADRSTVLAAPSTSRYNRSKFF